MGKKLLYSSLALMAAGTVGIIVAIYLEIITGEPVYYLVMKISAVLFGVGGPLLGISVARRKNRR